MNVPPEIFDEGAPGGGGKYRMLGFSPGKSDTLHWGLIQLTSPEKFDKKSLHLGHTTSPSFVQVAVPGAPMLGTWISISGEVVQLNPKGTRFLFACREVGTAR